MFGLDLAALMAVGGLVVPPVFHLLKGWFLPDKKDDPESTMSTLAITEPDVLAPYVESLAKYVEAQVKFFNRDVSGTPAQWVVNLRASIRPTAAAFGLLALVGEGLLRFWVPTTPPLYDPATRGFFAMSVTSWFGGKVLNGGG